MRLLRITTTLGWLLSFFLPIAVAVEPPDEERDRLTVASLIQKGESPELIHNAYFAPIGEGRAAHHEFAGTLLFPPSRMEMSYTSAMWQQWFPAVSVSFFSHRGYLIPLEPDIVRDQLGETSWGIVFSPGRVWSEAADGDWSRASFPFVLTGPSYNDSHNGIATFVYREGKISRLRFQIVKESANWNRFVAWGEIEPQLTPLVLQDRERLVAEFETEQNARLPVVSLSDLESRTGVNSLAVFNHRYDNPYLSVSGLVIDGKIYRGECRTSSGNYPYCDEMRHGGFSITKSMGAMLSLLWLAQKFGGEIFDYKIRDYLDVTASHDGWEQVTFADALNMVTGVGDMSHSRTSTDNDEDDLSFFYRFSENKHSLERKLELVFSGANYPWGPGEVYRYRTVDTFVLAAAMDSLLKRREGPSANLWDRLTEEVLKPIGINVAPMLHTVEPGGSRGVPILGAGLYVTVDEVAKVAALLHNGGRHGDQQLLHPTKLTDALTLGLTHGKPTAWVDHGNEHHYYLSLWHLNVDLSDCSITVPTMVGFGSNIVQLLPHGVTSFYLEDGGRWNVTALAQAAHRARSLCP